MIFLNYFIVIILHEFGHSFAAGQLGYKLKNLSLMPQGALVYGASEFNRINDEIKIAMAGPLVNLVLGSFCVSLWWLWPETYFITEVFVYANVFTLLLNLLPIMPLDGGRIFLAVFSHFNKRKLGITISNIIMITTSIVLLSLFVFSMFNLINFTFLIMAVFILLGGISAKRDNSYENIFSKMLKNLKLETGAEANYFVISENSSILKLIKNLKPKKYNIALLTNEFGEVCETLYQDEIEKLLENSNSGNRINFKSVKRM